MRKEKLLEQMKFWTTFHRPYTKFIEGVFHDALLNKFGCDEFIDIFVQFEEAELEEKPSETKERIDISAETLVEHKSSLS